MKQISEAKTLSYFNKLKKIQQQSGKYEKISELATAVKVDYVLCKELKENGILIEKDKKIVWHDKIPVSTVLANTMFTKCRGYYTMKRKAERIRTERKKKLSLWQRFKKLCGW